jgi:sulfopyruvate decarboxylase alpha subunit
VHDKSRESARIGIQAAIPALDSDMPFSLYRKACRPLKSGAESTPTPNGTSDMDARHHTPAETQPSWPEDIFEILQRFDVRQVAYVPDAGHSQLIEQVLAEPSMRAVSLTTEEEGVALLAGAWVGGERGVLLMQSSGVGNCINMLSLTHIFRLPFLTLVTMRGEWGEFNPWQVPMGSTTPGVLELSGIKVLRASHPSEVRDVVEAAAGQAYNACTPSAVLLSQRLIGAKVFVK